MEMMGRGQSLEDVRRRFSGDEGAGWPRQSVEFGGVMSNAPAMLGGPGSCRFLPWVATGSSGGVRALAFAIATGARGGIVVDMGFCGGS